MLNINYFLKDVLIAKIRTASKFIKVEVFALSVSVSLSVQCPNFAGALKVC